MTLTEFVIHLKILACIIKTRILDIIWPCLLIIMIMTWRFEGILSICALVVSFAALALLARAANDTTRASCYSLISYYTCNMFRLEFLWIIFEVWSWLWSRWRIRYVEGHILHITVSKITSQTKSNKTKNVMITKTSLRCSSPNGVRH